MHRIRPLSLVAAILAIGIGITSCRDAPLAPVAPTEPDSGAPLLPIGTIEVTLSGIGTPEMSATAVPLTPSSLLGAGSQALLPDSVAGGIQLESVGTGSFTEGTRDLGGQRYIQATFRVRNAAADGTPYPTPRRNITFVAVETAGTIAGTPISRLRRFDGTPADEAIAADVVPTGAVVLDEALAAQSAFPDVLQVFTEAELAAFTAPAGVTDRFPYGFVVRNPESQTDRVLPGDPAAEQFDGLVTFAFRLPLQPHDEGGSNGASKDPFTVTAVFLAVEDSETRLTESIEEQSAAARAAVQARATALGASSVTVLNGSPSTAYPGLRRLCDVRTAGSPASPTRRITAPGAFTRIEILRPGESLDGCAAGFRSGEPARPATNVPFTVSAYAMDRYGNVRTDVAAPVTLEPTLGVAAVSEPSLPLVAGTREFVVTYAGYGSDTLRASARQVRGWREVPVLGVTRAWTGAESSDWHDGANWDGGAVPMDRDSVLISVGAPQDPQLALNVAVQGVTVEAGASLAVGPFDLTAAGNVLADGPITATSGRLRLSGTAMTLRGTVPRLSVTGLYSLVGNVNATAPVMVDGGRITDGAYRLQVQ